jgi:hypothetical protein
MTFESDLKGSGYLFSLSIVEGTVRRAHYVLWVLGTESRASHILACTLSTVLHPEPRHLSFVWVI